MNQYKGFELFNDVEDDYLRNRNRAVVLQNIAQDHSKNGKISAKGFNLFCGYFDSVPDEDRQHVRSEFEIRMGHKNQ